MTNSEKRVAVAKDVLKQLAARKIKASPGVYLHAELKKGAPGRESDGGDGYSELTGSLQDHLTTKVKRCEVCALGAAFVSYVRLFNKVNIGDETDTYGGAIEGYYSDLGGEINAYRPELQLKRIFSMDQLDLMEAAFEGERGPQAYSESFAFYKKYRTPTKRLEGIMRNIIKNKGTFKP